jgi:hypothetical protein
MASRLVVPTLVALLLMSVPTSALAVGSDEDAPLAQKNATVGGHRTTLTTQFDPGGRWNPNRVPDGRGQLRGRLGYGARGPDSDGGPVVTGAAACGDGPLLLDTQWQQLPAVRIETSPSRAGVVNVETYFWIDGSSSNFNGSRWVRNADAHWFHTDPLYDAEGQFITCSEPVENTLIVQLYYWPVWYEWDYGDDRPKQKVGCPEAGEKPGDCKVGVGNPDPRLIHHKYEVSSPRADHEDGYPVTVMVTFSVAMGSGGEIFNMGEVQQPIWMHLPVREVQSVLVDE